MVVKRWLLRGVPLYENNRGQLYNCEILYSRKFSPGVIFFFFFFTGKFMDVFFFTHSYL